MFLIGVNPVYAKSVAESKVKWRRENKDRQIWNTRQWREKNADYVKARKRAYYELRRDEILEKSRHRYEGLDVKRKDAYYLRRVKDKYGLSAADHAALFELQGGRCGICYVHQDAIGERLAVDHDHKTGEVRGLLCRACNQGLGYHEKRGTGAWSNYTAFPPMKELQYRRNTPLHEQVHPY